MKDIGLLFTDEMVRAYLAARKTQTRRPARLTATGLLKLRGNHAATLRDHGPVWRPAGGDPEQPLTGPDLERFSPFGAPGDRLWVREAARLSSASGTGGVTDTVRLCYRAANELLSPTHHREDWSPYAADRWTPSMSMPRWAARLVLPIVSVRVERVQDITEDDAQAEGVGHGYVPYPHPTYPDLQTTRCVGHRPMFLRLWRELYGDRYPPETAWCWVIETEPYKGTER